MTPESCYVCGTPGWPRYCPVCDAPLGLERGTTVYVLRAECGLYKIGHTEGAVRRRYRTIWQKSGQPIALARTIPQASWLVETWLHRWFESMRTEQEARSRGLVNPSEWFKPCLEIGLLAAGLPLVNLDLKRDLDQNLNLDLKRAREVSLEVTATTRPSPWWESWLNPVPSRTRPAPKTRPARPTPALSQGVPNVSSLLRSRGRAHARGTA